MFFVNLDVGIFFKSNPKTGFRIFPLVPCYVKCLHIETDCVLSKHMTFDFAFIFDPVIQNFILLLTWAIPKRHNRLDALVKCTITVLCLTRFKLVCDNSAHFLRDWSVCQHRNLKIILAEVLRLKVRPINKLLVEFFILF